MGTTQDVATAWHRAHAYVAGMHGILGLAHRELNALNDNPNDRHALDELQLHIETLQRDLMPMLLTLDRFARLAEEAAPKVEIK